MHKVESESPLYKQHEYTDIDIDTNINILISPIPLVYLNFVKHFLS